MMTRTKDFKQTVQACLREEPAFREAMLTEAMNCFLAGGKPPLQHVCDTTSNSDGAMQQFMLMKREF